MSREPTTQTLTVIVVADERSPMRRFHVSIDRLKRAGIAAGAVLILLAIGLVDYVRLRIDAIEVERLSAETLAQREQVETMVGSLESLEGELERIRDLERKVRVIANLPKSQTELAGQPEDATAHQGGSAEAIVDPASGVGEAVGVPPGDGADAPEEVSLSRLHQNHLELVTLARVHRKAERLAPQAAARSSSLEELVEQLHGKSSQLASTPSIWPTRGWLTSRYGYRVSPFTGRRQFHAGLDVAAGIGTDIVAPARGRVVAVGRKGALGRRLVIDHGYGVRTTYGHVREFFVKKGDVVERGQRIAAVGTSGRSTGPHLHYAVAVAGKARDPIDYILD